MSFSRRKRAVCGPLERVHPLELTGTDADRAIGDRYAAEIRALIANERTHVIELKGIRMDGHWGFHGAETPLDADPGFMEVEIGSQNARQQRIDWPELFRSDDDVPATAYTAKGAPNGGNPGSSPESRPLVPASTLARLDHLWEDAEHLGIATSNRAIMHGVLHELGLEL